MGGAVAKRSLSPMRFTADGLSSGAMLMSVWLKAIEWSEVRRRYFSGRNSSATASCSGTSGKKLSRWQ